MEALQSFIATLDPKDPPVMRDYPHLPLVVLPLYVAFVFLGPMVMKNRKISFFDKTMKWWNLSLSLGSGVCFVYWAYLVGEYALRVGFANAICMPDLELWQPGHHSNVLCFAFMWSKYVELGDTVFLVFRGKQVPFLHWYHHVTVLYFCWLGMFSMIGFGMYFGIINSFVHTIMYYYYFLTADGGEAPVAGAPRVRKLPWWGQYLTRLQLAQMLVGLAITSVWTYLWASGYSCPLNNNVNAYIIISYAAVMYASYFYLFFVMYMDKYKKDKAARLARKEAADKKASEAIAPVVPSSSVAPVTAPVAGVTKRTRTPIREH